MAAFKVFYDLTGGTIIDITAGYDTTVDVLCRAIIHIIHRGIPKHGKGVRINGREIHRLNRHRKSYS